MIRQGTEEWIQQRIGKCTASKFAAIMTNGRGKTSMGVQGYKYLWDLVTEHFTGLPQDKAAGVSAMEWGNDKEDEARAAYSLASGNPVDQTGIIFRDDFFGGSPDGLIGDGGGVEIKCPYNSSVHLSYLNAGVLPKDYFWQVHGLMWITGRSWWDFVSFDPRMPRGLSLMMIRVERNAQLMDSLEERAYRFKGEFDHHISTLTARHLND